jgi:hypothetical protein
MATDAVPDLKAGQSPPEVRSPRSASGPKTGSEASAAPRRRRGRKETAEALMVERFFLAEANESGGMPALGREMPSEAEAIVEAFRAGVNFFSISEFRTRAETSSPRYPVIKKEAVRNGNHSSLHPAS